MVKRPKGEPVRPKFVTIPWEARVDFKQAQSIMLALAEREDVRAAFEWFVSEFHNNVTYREHQEYMAAEGAGRIGVDQPAVQELMIRPFIDQFEVIWKFWSGIRRGLIHAA